MTESITLDATKENKLIPEPEIPKCISDTTERDYSGITITCKLYESNKVTLVATLVNCVIPANTMEYPNQY